MATTCNSIQCINYLIKQKIPVDIMTNKGDTPLHLATATQNLEMIKVICEFKANPNVKNYSGVTPTDFAECLRNSAIKNIFKQ